nr:VTC domain-containing protein [uncultured Blautia sp.]
MKKEKASGMGCDEKTRNTLSVSRREVKYLLSLPDRLYLLDALDRLLTPDAYGGYNGYTVRSVYFDSIVNEDYMDKKNHADEKNGLSGSGSKRVYR